MKPSIAKWYSDSKSNFNSYDGIDVIAGSNDTANEKEDITKVVVSSSSSSSSTSSTLDNPSLIDIPPPIYSLILFGPPGTET